MVSSLNLRRSIFHTQALAFVVATAAAFLQPVRAEAILDLVMDDPTSLLSSHPEGLSKLTPAFSSSTATIASGFGGRAVPQLSGGPSGGSPEAKVQILSEPALGPKPFFRATLNGASEAKQVGLGIIASKDASLQTFVSRENGLVKISGRFDFLFRVTSSSGSPKFILSTKIAHLGMVISTNPGDGTIALKAFTGGKSLDVNGDKIGDRSTIEKRAETRLENDAICHGAVLFKTAADGSLSISLCISQGPGALDSHTSVAAVIEGFWLLEESGGAGTDKVVMSLGRDETSQQTLDVAAFRIFKSAPESFPAFEAK